LRICTARDFRHGIILKVITLLPLLQTLQISHSPEIQIKVLLDILRQLPNLKVLDLVHSISLDTSDAILLKNYMLENKVLQTFCVGQGDGKLNVPQFYLKDGQHKLFCESCSTYDDPDMGVALFD